MASLAAGLRLPKIVSDGMVLQAERPVAFGWSSASAVLAELVGPDGAVLANATATPSPSDGGLFVARMRALPPSDPAGEGVTLRLTEAGASAPPTLVKRVLLGSVYVVSGQSNAEFSIPTAFDGQAFIDDAADAGMRILTVQKNASDTPLDDVIALEHPWRELTPSSACGGPAWANQSDYCEPHCASAVVVPSFKRVTWGYFTALGFLAGRAMRRAFPDRAVGVVATSWGGTRIEPWSPPAALRRCGGSPGVPARDGADGGGVAASSLWNGMVHPLRFLPVEAFLWMQGEANSGSEAAALAYACQLPAMVDSWRSVWEPRFDGAPNASLFTAVHIAPYRAAPSVAALRWSQRAVAALPNASLAATTDLFDPNSPCGNVHFRDKQPAAVRVAATWRAVARRDARAAALDPEPIAATGAASGGVDVRVAPHAAAGLGLGQQANQTTSPAWTGFELLLNGSWTCADGVIADAGSASEPATVRVTPRGHAGAEPQAVRYAWAPVPSGSFLTGATIEAERPGGEARTVHRVAPAFAFVRDGRGDWAPLPHGTAIPGGDDGPAEAC